MDRDALLKTLRGVNYDGLDRSVDVAISRLRKKLLDSAAEPYRIKTIRNKGYLFAPHARTKRRDKLADRFYLPLSSHSGDAHHRHCSKTGIAYMDAIFISRNSPFITVFSALRFFITSFSPKIKLKNSKPVHKIDNRMSARRYIAIFFANCEIKQITTMNI